MSLSTTLNIAQQALSTNAALSTIVSRNIAGVNDPGYSTKTAQLSTTQGGGVRIAGVTSAAGAAGSAAAALFANLLAAKAGAASSSALSSGLDQLEQTLGLSTTTAADGTATDSSPATLIGKLGDALQLYANAPSDASAGAAAVASAKGLAADISGAALAVQSVRQGADKGIAAAVGTVNTLLGQFATTNRAVVFATASGADATDAIDARNAVLQSLSAQIGVTTADAGNGGLALYTDGGATLFQGTARTVALAPAGASGFSDVTVDGVRVTGPAASMPSKGGAIAGLAQLRDTTAAAYGAQLDQIAGSLISAFSETGRTDGGTATSTLPGLFTTAGAAAGSTPGLAGSLAASLTVSAAVDPSQNGDVTLLRDGGINDHGSNTSYRDPAAGGASYSGHLVALLGKLDGAQSPALAAGGAVGTTLPAYAASSVSWLEAARQSASTDATDRTAVVTQTTTSLSSATGVNLDEQLSKMLDLEHSYQASAELLTTTKAMLDALLQAVN